jgi:Right handed beta helix region
MKLVQSCGALACLVLSLFGVARAEDIPVVPGAGALAAALAKAKSGDVVKVAAGEYNESVVVGEGVTIEGAGASESILIAPEYAALNCQGPHVRVVGLTIRGGEKNVRGVNASQPVRIERCRFENLKEGVALMAAPLSDIIACEFEGGGIAVRAIGGASPTVWGCVFKNCQTGIFAMNGSPYVRNNLFDGVKNAVRFIPNTTRLGIIRNNVFVECEKSAIEVVGEGALASPSIRNNIFIRGGAALVAPSTLSSRVSHCVLSTVPSPPFRDADGKATLNVGESGLVESEPPVSVGQGGLVQIIEPKVLDGRGARLCAEAEGSIGSIGLEKSWLQLGIAATGTLPAQRFGGTMLIANSVKEEHLYLETLGRGFTKQALIKQDGIHTDRITLDGNGKPEEIVFDISRFFGEEAVK